VMFRPSRGRKPWSARVLSMGHGPRIMMGLEISFLEAGGSMFEFH
jgi:hypothetical protein